jgi:hypothetical protein
VFQSAAYELTQRLQHGHGNNEWHDMVEVSPSHDAAEGDPERSWTKGRIFRCTTCEDEIRIMTPDLEPPSQRP